MDNFILFIDDSAAAGRNEARLERRRSGWIEPALERVQEFLPPIVGKQRPDTTEQAWVTLLECERLRDNGSCEG